MNAKREAAIERICARTNKTREQAEAFLDVLGSGLRRRGWIEGEPLSQQEISEQLDVFIGEDPDA